MVFIPVTVKLSFKHPLLQSSVSIDFPDITLICRFGAKDTFIIIIIIITVVLLNILRKL